MKFTKDPAAMESPRLKLTGVCKGYGVGSRRTEVLDDINLEVERGEFVAIVGYSGSGKTTLISLIAGLSQPDAGQILMDGTPVVAPGSDRGVVFQNYSLLPWMTVYQNVALAVDQLPGIPAGQKRSLVERYVAMVGLSRALQKKPAELSGGMRQRVAVARALALNPEVLLMDEPFGALDALTRATIQDEIERIWQHDQKTVVLITNDVEEALLLADRVIPLSAGPRATLGPAVDVPFDRPRDRKQLARDPEFRRLKTSILDWLLGSGGRRPRSNSPQRELVTT